MVKLSKAFYVSFPIVSAISTIFLVVAAFILLGSNDISSGMAFLFFGLVGLIYATVVILLLFYQMWKSIHDNSARMSPGRAVGFLFIPFFNVYWIFQVLWGFAKDYNSYIARNSINTRKLSEGVLLAWAVLLLVSGIPYLNFIALPAYWIVSGIGISRICDAVNALALREISPAGALRLYFLSGEFMNHALEVPPAGLFIGRDPARANVIFNSAKISSLHVRLEPNQLQHQLWVEDLNSLNGTFYLAGGAGGNSDEKKWVRLKGKLLLPPGVRLRLADDVAEFEVRKA